MRDKVDPEKDIIRHYDVTGKLCPKYYVEHPDAWEKLKKDAKSRIDKTEEDLKKESIPFDLADADGKVIKEDNKE